MAAAPPTAAWWLFAREVLSKGRGSSSSSSNDDEEENPLPSPPLLQQAIEHEQLTKLREYITSLGGNLDGGWRCRANIRDFGSRAGSMDTWFTAPHGETFRSKVAVSGTSGSAVTGGGSVEGGRMGAG